MKRLWVQIMVLMLLIGIAVYFGWRGVGKVRRSMSETALCTAVREGRPEEALALGEQISASGLYDPVAAECHCAALVEVGRGEECIPLIEDLLARPEAGDWLPGPSLAAVVVGQRSARGELPGAAELAHRAALRNPHDYLLLYLEMNTRVQLENEDTVLREMLRRLPSAGPAAPRLLLEIARRYVDRSLWQEGLALLGDVPPSDPELRSDWFELRLKTLAGLGRPNEMLATAEAWKAAGETPEVVEARYAGAISIYTLSDPRGIPTLELLRNAMEGRDRIESEDLRRGLSYRFIGTLVLKGHHEEALQQFDLAVAENGELFGLTREEILRISADDLAEPTDLSDAAGTLVVEVSELRQGDRLLLSPPPPAAADAEYEEVSIQGEEPLVLKRAVGGAPVRWVLQDSGSHNIGSGTVWPVPGSTVPVRITRRRASTRPPSYQARSSPGDGRRRVFVTILDCADWQLIQYLRHRDELPVLDSLLRTGARGVVTSEPPFTAAAIAAIANPGKQGISSFLGLLYQLGAEVEGLNFVGTNPFGQLRWVTPGGDDLFTALGGTHLSVVNMLHSYGPLQAGRNAQMVGPHGRTRRISGMRGSRRLTPEERGGFPGLLEADDRGRALVEEMAADFDALDTQAADASADLVLLRVASLDVFTHSHFTAVVQSGQDDADRPLFWVYRYIDWRLGELNDALDRDDVLIVMSDHGIRTALEHDRRSFFVAAGGDVPAGRIDGSPHIRGTGLMLANLFGVKTDWPATGMEEWVSALPVL